MIDVLCIGAHPDDVELAMGGTVAKLVREGLAVGILDLTDGEPTPYGTHELRMVEAAAAAQALGVTWRRTLELPNRELADTSAARRMVAEVIRAESPRILFSHYPTDGHPDHVAAAALVEAARFWSKLVKTDMAGAPHYPPRLYQFPAVHLRLTHKPAFIVDISETLAAKMAAVRCYASQFLQNPKNRDFVQFVETTASYFGGLIRVGAGEPFFSKEEVGVPSVSALL